jgi:hypothetical protein
MPRGDSNQSSMRMEFYELKLVITFLETISIDLVSPAGSLRRIAPLR